MVLKLWDAQSATVRRKYPPWRGVGGYGRLHHWARHSWRMGAI